jgi:hypothetical protein
MVESFWERCVTRVLGLPAGVRSEITKQSHFVRGGDGWSQAQSSTEAVWF